MAVITLSTVGFKEVHPLSPAGQYFTILYIIVSVFTAGFTVSRLLAFFFEGQIAGKRMAAVATQPAIVDFLDVISSDSPSEMGIQAVRIPAGSVLAGKTLRESNVGQYTGAIIIGIIGPDGLARTNPSAMSTLSAVVLQAGDQLIALGNEEQVGNLRAFCG